MFLWKSKNEGKNEVRNTICKKFWVGMAVHE